MLWKTNLTIICSLILWGVIIYFLTDFEQLTVNVISGTLLIWVTMTFITSRVIEKIYNK
jgi:Flp pilus assembly protein TadB